MSKLYTEKVVVNGNGHLMSVGFNRYGNKHLINDVINGKTNLKLSELVNVNTMLANSTFVTKSKLYKERKDDIKRFYYYKLEHEETTLFLQVAETDLTNKKGKIRHNRFLYSITKKIKS